MGEPVGRRQVGMPRETHGLELVPLELAACVGGRSVEIDVLRPARDGRQLHEAVAGRGDPGERFVLAEGVVRVRVAREWVSHRLLRLGGGAQPKQGASRAPTPRS